MKGTELAREHGLILVDTKYEFGMNNGELILIDEIHTPDSSRYWYSDTYEQLFMQGEKQRKLDKEYLRQWLMEQNYSRYCAAHTAFRKRTGSSNCFTIVGLYARNPIAVVNIRSEMEFRLC